MAQKKQDDDRQASSGKDAVSGQQAADQALEQGFLGHKVDPRPNEEYSQETDPLVSPSALEQRQDVLRAQVDSLGDSAA